MIVKIREAGLTDAKIAELLSTPTDSINQSVVCSWKNGVHLVTTYDRHIRVIELYKKLKRQRKIKD